MALNKINLLVAGPASPVSDALVRTLDPEKMSVSVCATKEDVFKHLAGGIVHALFLSGGAGAHEHVDTIREIRERPATFHLPVFLISDLGEARNTALFHDPGVDCFFGYDPGNFDDRHVVAFLSRIIRRVEEVFHPVSRLLAGPALADTLARVTRDVKKSSLFLLVKLHGMKAYNLHKNYDDGDNMLATFAAALSQTVAAAGNLTDIVGHIHADEFCVFTQEKRVENLCKSILVKTERLIRTYYTPYELMRGYVTIEADKHKGHYFLAEPMIAGIEIPAHWDSHHKYIIDLAKDLLKKIEAEDLNYKIVKIG